MKTTYLKILGATIVSAAAMMPAAHAGVGCDLNLRVNNQTPNAVTIFGDNRSGASKAGLNLWNPIDGLSDAVLDPEGSGAASHSKQAVELGPARSTSASSTWTEMLSVGSIVAASKSNPATRCRSTFPERIAVGAFRAHPQRPGDARHSQSGARRRAHPIVVPAERVALRRWVSSRPC